MLRLDEKDAFVRSAVQAIAQGTLPPEPPIHTGWRDRAVEHGVLSVLAWHLEQVDDPFLRTVRRQHTAQHLTSMADLRAVHDALAGAGVEWLLFKGPVLSEAVYQRAGTRSYGDLDVLVRPADVDLAITALRVAGAVPWGHGRFTQAADEIRQLTLVMPQGSPLDLHWDIVAPPVMRRAFSVDTEELFRESRTVVLDGLAVRTLGPVDTALHVALHGMITGERKLRCLLDVHQAVLRLSRPSELLDRARQFGLELVLRTMLWQVHEVVDATLAVNLPRPRLSQSCWLAVNALGMALFPPGSWQHGLFTGRSLEVAVRAEPLASWGALIKILRVSAWQRVRGARQFVPVPPPNRGRRERAW